MADSGDYFDHCFDCHVPGFLSTIVKIAILTFDF